MTNVLLTMSTLLIYSPTYRPIGKVLFDLPGFNLDLPEQTKVNLAALGTSRPKPYNYNYKLISKVPFDNPGVNSDLPERIKANLAALGASRPKFHNYPKASNPTTPVAPIRTS